MQVASEELSARGAHGLRLWVGPVHSGRKQQVMIMNGRSPVEKG
jgi:hypothetical protein